MNRMHSRWLVAAVAALVATGCAQSNGDISYVQPNYVKKKDLLDGVWYIRNTVTKTPATTGFTFAGETGHLEKVVFEIQENHLVAYRAYAQIPGLDQSIEDASRPSGTTTTYCETNRQGVRTCVGGHKYYGAPVFAWPIKKHFDIQRGYNPATGEQTNVISENASDRPWNEREYIRVNWTSNGMGWSMGSWGMINPRNESDFSGMIYANEPNSDPYDWPRMEFQEVNGEQKMTYFEFTGRYMARPDERYFPEYGATLPLCWLSPAYDCAPAQIEMRTSMAKVDQNKTLDYEPLIYDNAMMAKFGYFRTERINYDRRFGFNQSDILYLANRHRIWENSFRRDAAGNVDWSQPIPMEQRTPKPIVYYVAPAYRMGGQAEYQKFWEASRILEAGWDKAFRRAVAAAQGKGDDWQSVPKMVYICGNPVPADAPAACTPPSHKGPEPFEARFGDLRYSFLWTIPEAVPNGLLGYGPSSADPETGEIISANSNTYSAAVARSAQHLMDQVNVLSGDLTIDDLIRGNDVLEYMRKNPSYARAQGQVAPLKSELQGDAVQKTGLPSLGAFDKPTNRIASLMATLKGAGGLPQAGGNRLQAAMEKLRQKPQLESMIIDNPEAVHDLMGLLPRGLVETVEQNPGNVREALRTAALNLPDLVALEEERQAYFASKNMCFNASDFEDRPLTGLAMREKARRDQRIAELMANPENPLTAEQAREIADREMRTRFEQHIWRATSEHEFGHTLGLRHNFQGSFDAINYFDGYWELKADTIALLQNGQYKVPRTPEDLRRASDGTEDQLLAGMHDYEYSSIMEYGGKANADWMGVGKYDEAAILFAYSGGTEPGYVEVFTGNLPVSADLRFPGTDGNELSITGAGYDLPVINALRTNTAVPNYTERFHYSTVPLRFGTGSTIPEIIVSGIDNLRRRTVMKWSEVRAKQEQLRQLLKNKPEPTVADIQAINPPLEVPYMFCTDNHVGYILSCNRWDRGPDYYEMTRTWLEDYWNGYFFNHFRRDRLSFSARSALIGTYSTFENVTNVHKHWTHALFGAQGPNAQNVPNYAHGKFGYDPLLEDTWTMAVLDGVNDFAKIMTLPPSGFMMLYTPADFGLRTIDGGTPRWLVIADGNEFDDLTPEAKLDYEAYYRDYYGAQAFVTVPRGPGRRMYSRYDYRSGFLGWDRVVEVGHYNDQVGAMFAATWPYAYFLGVDDRADQNRYSISYYLTFRDEMSTIFGGLWGSNEPALRPTLYLSQGGDGQPQANVLYPVWVKGQNYIEGFNYPKEVKPSELPAGALAEPVDIQPVWTTRFYSLLLGLVNFSSNFDLDFAKQNQIFKLGTGQDLTVPPGWEKVSVTDPVSGSTYAAMRRIGDTKETPAVRMIRRAQDYLDIVNDPRIVMTREADKVNQALIEQTRSEYAEALRSQIGYLDAMNDFYQIFGSAF